MRRVAVPLGLFVSLALIVLSGWLGYSSVNGSGFSLPSLPSSSASPTPVARGTTVRVTRGDVRQLLTVPGQVAPAVQQQLSMPAGGRLLEVTVRAGDTVTKGQTLARMDAEPLQLALEQAQVDRDAKQAALDELKAGASVSDLTAANAAVKDAQTGLQNAQLNQTTAQNSDTVMKNVRDREYEAAWYEANYGDMINKYNAGKIDKTRLDLEYNNLLAAKERLATAQAQAALTMNQANQQLANAQESLRKAQESLKTLKAGADPTAIKQAELALTSADVALKQAEANLAGATLVAPFSGRVLAVSAMSGDSVAANATFITLADLSKLEVQATVGQEDVAQVHAGQAAALSFDARAGETFNGVVDRVVPTRASTSGAVNYAVYVTVNGAPEGLLPGMTADADIIVAERKEVLTLPRRSIRARANATITVQVLQGGRAVSRNVQIGLLGDLTVEVVSGLQEGDQVVSSQ